MDESKIHVVMEVESMEKAKEFSTDLEISRKREEAGVLLD